MASAAGRIYAFDWLRGVAVLVMIQTHSLGLLLPELQKGAFFNRLQMIDGLVAPSFIFSAGFAIALVQVRAGLAGRRMEQLKKSLKRITEVLFVAEFINFIWFNVIREPKWLLRIDILHCIALSLYLVMPVLFALAMRPKLLRWVLLIIALCVFAVAPLGEQVTGWPSLFLNTNFGVLDDTTGAGFPLLPWTGYVFLGASFGATIGSMKSEAELWQWLGLLIGLGAVLWFFDRPQIEGLYPPHHFWVTNPANAAQRWTYVLSLVAIFRLIERRWPASAQSAFFKWLAGFGAASLSAYFFHEMLLFHYRVGLWSKFFKGQASWALFWPLVIALIFATWLCVKAWDRIDPKLRALFTSSKEAKPQSAS
ncbi:MAG: heparan-alpha-glucosaminide N-acetyltransferase domain-containing protein [Archangium sp.]